MTADRRDALRGAALALFAFAVYSGHDTVVKWLGASYSPVQVLFFATLFGFPIVTIMLMRDPEHRNLRPRHPWWTLTRTAAAVLNTLTTFYAFAALPLAQTYAIIFAMPLLITLLAVPMLGERVGWRRSLAIGVGLIGVIVVLRPGSTSFEAGHAAAVVAAVSGALATVIVRKIGADERSAVLLLYPMMANFIVAGAALGLVYRPMPGAHLGGVALIAGLGFLGGVVIISAYRAARAAVVAPMQFSQIVWATIFGYAFFGETPDLGTAIGAAIVIGSGLYLVFREERPAVSRTRPVLNTRSRYVSGVYPRIGSFLRYLQLAPEPLADEDEAPERRPS